MIVVVLVGVQEFRLPIGILEILTQIGISANGEYGNLFYPLLFAHLYGMGTNKDTNDGWVQRQLFFRAGFPPKHIVM